MEQQKTNNGEKPIWQIWVTSNYPTDNYTMLIQCDTQEQYNNIVNEIRQVVAKYSDDELHKY
jgi:hypothetical protein